MSFCVLLFRHEAHHLVLHVAPLRKPGDEGTVMLWRVIDGGRLPENPLIPLDVVDMEIAAARVTGTSELGEDTTCASLDRELVWGYPGGGMFTRREVGVLLPKSGINYHYIYISSL